MPIAAILALAIMQQPNAGRYEMAERLKRLDVAWLSTEKSERKRDAVADISTGVTSFFSGKYDEAAESLDRAVAKLEGRSPRASDALSIRSESPFYEPGASVKLRLTWTYQPNSVVPVRIGSGSRFIDLKPGKDGSLVVNPSESNPELRQNQEVGYLLPVRAGEDTRFVYLSFVRNYKTRVEALTRSDDPFGRVNGQLLTKFLGDPRAQEVELPLIQYLFSAENVSEQKQKISDQEQVYYAVHGATTFRAQFPRTLRGKTGEAVNVVIAAHGAGGSENMFFESYGRGEAVTEALKRKWVFVSPRAGVSTINDVIDWLTKVRGLTVNKLFLLGHSMGAGSVLSSEPTVKPSAVAALAPAGFRVSDTIKAAPVFIGVGKQEMSMLQAAASNIAKQFDGRTDFEFKEYDPCEHLMIGADAIPDAFKFFDRFAG